MSSVQSSVGNEPALSRCLVLMATYNGAKYIGQQVRSLLAQDRVQVLVDIRDDDSADGTRDVIRGLAGSDSLVCLRQEHSATGSAAGNFFKLMLGADLTGIDYVALCDQDDLWARDKLARAVGCLSASGAAGYSTAVTAVWPDGRRKSLVQSSAIRAADYLFEGAGQGCTFVVTAALFSEVQALLRRHESLLAPIRYHDWTLYALARTLAHRWYFDSAETMQYLQHESNDTGARSSGAGVARRLALIRQGWYRAQVDAVTRLVLAVNPADAGALRWRALAGRAGVRGRLARLCFVATKGRRRFSDRMVLMGAALAGYL